MSMFINDSRYGMVLGHEVDLAKSRLADAEHRCASASNPISKFLGNWALNRSTRELNRLQMQHDEFFGIDTIQLTIVNEISGGEV